jgi:hypothetical protein
VVDVVRQLWKPGFSLAARAASGWLGDWALARKFVDGRNPVERFTRLVGTSDGYTMGASPWISSHSLRSAGENLVRLSVGRTAAGSMLCSLLGDVVFKTLGRFLFNFIFVLSSCSLDVSGGNDWVEPFIFWPCLSVDALPLHFHGTTTIPFGGR